MYEVLFCPVQCTHWHFTVGKTLGEGNEDVELSHHHLSIGLVPLLLSFWWQTTNAVVVDVQVVKDLEVAADFCGIDKHSKS